MTLIVMDSAAVNTVENKVAVPGFRRGGECIVGNWIVGPAKLPCERQCDLPEGVRATGVPVPRHNWGDVFVCPYDCGRAWLIKHDEEQVDSGHASQS